ncbi:MAG TPA: hypothetical protein VIN39_05910 [Candidatus Dormibacteraeota bacterium]
MVNVVASVLLILSFLPVYFAQRLTQESGGLTSAGRAVVAPQPGD